MGKKKTFVFLLLFLAGVLLVIYMTGDSYYQGLLGETGVGEKEKKTYTYKYDMIVDRPESSFWQEVYSIAKKSAQENGALLELKDTGKNGDYNKIDFMNMSIAAKVDGIILQYNGEAGLEEKINEAVEADIPVVTVMGDAVHSKRQSFVGVSDYQLGTAYGEKVAEYVNEDTKSILILLKKNIDDMNQSQIYTQISNAAQERAAKGQKIKVTGRNLLSAGTFEVEEVVTDIFQQKNRIPDILVCMDEDTTECARQAVIDFNQAGKVQIIGYYTSLDILSAVEKGVISVTCDVDTTQLGQYCIEALTEYLGEGRTNSYYNVDIRFLDQADIRKIRKGAGKSEKVSMEGSVAGK